MRRLTHSAHHRGQLTVYLRLLGRPVYSTYRPTADTGGLWPELPGPGEKPATERP